MINSAASWFPPLRNNIGCEVRHGRRLLSSWFLRFLCPIALISCLAGIALPARAQFETRTLDPTDPYYGAFSVATGDFNHDGKLDVAIINDNGFSVMLGNGDGTFRKAVFYSTQLAYSLAVGDFNKDGDLDIVVANENSNPSTVSVYLGNGDGTFKTPIDSNTTQPNQFVAVGDFNGDHKLDIAVIDSPYISILLGNGDGTFQPPSDNDSFRIPQWLAVGDFNNDHKLDVITTGSFGASYDIGVLLGNGNGTLENSITTPIEYVPGTITVGDLNGDGNLDAVLGYDLDGMAVLLGNGDGTFQPAVNYDTTGLGGGYLVVSDLNLDGKLDVMVPSGPPGVDVFWGNGDGTLQPAEGFASGASGIPAVGDLNGDHLPDIILGQEFFTTTMLNTGVVSFSPATAPLAFPVQLINTSSPQQTVTLTNDGTSTLSISSVKVSGPFQMSTTCGSMLLAAGDCSISSLFRPRAAGTFTGSITIIDSASSKPQFVDLTGSAAALKVSPAALNFGSQKVGTKSAPKTVTATNVGRTAILISSVTIGGTDRADFSETDDCAGQAIQPKKSCTATVTFDPAKTGARSAGLYFNLPTGAVSPAPATLTGNGGKPGTDGTGPNL